MGDPTHSAPIATEPPGPAVGLALGGGGARGLAHIPVLEAFDELGLKPRIIAGTSIGAIIGAAYASGMEARRIRAHADEVLGQWTDIARHLFTTTSRSLLEQLSLRPFSTALIKPETLMDAVLPTRLKNDFAGLELPLKIVATDYHAQAPYVMEKGALLPAVAASVALPALFKPVRHDGRILLDGGLTNPLPFDLVEPSSDITVASHVLGGPSADRGNAEPSSLEAAIASSQIMQNAIVREKLKTHAPDIVLKPSVNGFRVLEFHRIREILRASAPIKDELKRALEARFNAVQQKTL
jgi:NTE family protein